MNNKSLINGVFTRLFILHNYCARYNVEQDNERTNLGNKWVYSGKIFVQWNGAPMFPQTPSKWFAKWLAQKELPKITFHQLRHSHASILIANGVDIATVSRRLGHAKISTTIDTYTHAIKSRDTAATNLLDNDHNAQIIKNHKTQ